MYKGLFVSNEDLLEKDIFELLGIPNAPEDQKNEILTTMIQTVNLRVAQRIADELTDEDAEQFKQLCESGDSDNVAAFLTEKNIDLPNIVAEEATRYRVEMASLIRLAAAGNTNE